MKRAWFASVSHQELSMIQSRLLSWLHLQLSATDILPECRATSWNRCFSTCLHPASLSLLHCQCYWNDPYCYFPIHLWNRMYPFHFLTTSSLKVLKYAFKISVLSGNCRRTFQDDWKKVLLKRSLFSIFQLLSLEKKNWAKECRVKGKRFPTATCLFMPFSSSSFNFLSYHCALEESACVPYGTLSNQRYPKNWIII